MKKTYYEKFGPHVGNDVLTMVCGRKIGMGASRIVYELATDPENKVVKVEMSAITFANANECQIWHAIRDTPLGKWCAPVLLIAPMGRAIVMRRTRPIRLEELPDKIPAFLNDDLKLENWGVIDGHPVCHDYGLLSLFDLFTKGTPARLAKAKWLRDSGSTVSKKAPSKKAETKPTHAN